jgi:hypothetical protein
MNYWKTYGKIRRGEKKLIVISSEQQREVQILMYIDMECIILSYTILWNVCAHGLGYTIINIKS